MGVLIVFFICLLCVYLAIGYTSSILIGAEDDTHVTIIFTLFWPVIWTFLILFCIVFTFIGRSSIKNNAL